MDHPLLAAPQRAYRMFSTNIQQDGDEVACEALSLDSLILTVGENPFDDIEALRRLARHWRSHLELGARRALDYDDRYQLFIVVDDRKIPVDHLCADLNGVSIRLDFTSFGLFLKVNDRSGRTTHHRTHKALRGFASALRRAASRG